MNSKEQVMTDAVGTEKQLIRVGHSPDPDDAFMFFALAKNRIETYGFTFKDVIEDIETLNQRAAAAELEVTAMSLHAYAEEDISEKYAVLSCGASFGNGYGPIVVSKTAKSLDELKGKRIAVPGLKTTAYLLLKLVHADFEEVVVPFDQIIDCVAAGKADAGLLIHEGQLTYSKYGMDNLLDLGIWWQEETGLPLPLGLDTVRRDLGLDAQRKIARILKDSIAYALENRAEALEYAMQYGRGLETDLADRFVGMYVNDITLDLGTAGKQGIEKLLAMGHERGFLKKAIKPTFVEPI